ncbi:MAG: hypothetical protein Q8O92_06450 [Candidatus Latescibacter sp.]|nr:hypothetical protein [Candidatus Latescibacter sp.]
MRRSKAVFMIMLTGIFFSISMYQGTILAEESPRLSHQMGHMMGDGDHGSGENSPGVAALLSLQPMPVDFGNFYLNNWRKGILYTTLELGMFIPGMALLGDHGMGFSDRSDGRSWNDSERVTFYSLLAAYIAVKVISAYDAGSTAERMARGNIISLNLNPREKQVIMSAHVSF